MLMRPQTILAAHGKPMPRSKIGATGIQIYAPGGVTWSKKAIIFRNAPFTIENPYLGQIEIRLSFADAANQAKGCRGLVDGLPCVAAHVRDVLTGVREADSLPPEEYESRKHPCFHTAEELRKMLEEKARRVRERLAAAPRF